MKTEFDLWWEGSSYYIPGNNHARYVAESAWHGRGVADKRIARAMNSPRLASALSTVDIRIALSTPDEVGQVHD